MVKQYSILETHGRMKLLISSKKPKGETRVRGPQCSRHIPSDPNHPSTSHFFIETRPLNNRIFTITCWEFKKTFRSSVCWISHWQITKRTATYGDGLLIFIIVKHFVFAELFCDW